jgi:hypothetical protein
MHVSTGRQPPAGRLAIRSWARSGCGGPCTCDESHPAQPPTLEHLQGGECSRSRGGGWAKAWPLGWRDGSKLNGGYPMGLPPLDHNRPTRRRGLDSVTIEFWLLQGGWLARGWAWAPPHPAHPGAPHPTPIEPSQLGWGSVDTGVLVAPGWLAAPGWPGSLVQKRQGAATHPGAPGAQKRVTNRKNDG